MRRAVVGSLLVALVGCAAALYVVVAQPPWFERIRYPLRYSEYVRVHARENGIDGKVLEVLIKKHREIRKSTGISVPIPDETSSRVTDAIVEWLLLRGRSDQQALFELDGAWYLGNLFRKYRNERLVLAAYNAGQGNVDRWRAQGRSIAFAETRAYVDRVEHLKHVYGDAWRSSLYS